MAIDKYLGWLNVNINLLDDKSHDKRISLLQRRKNRYKRDILMQARDTYMGGRDHDVCGGIHRQT